MQLKLKAGLQAAAIVAVVLLTVLGLQELSTLLTAKQVATICGSALMCWLVYILYLILLNRLEYNQKINEFNRK